MCMSGATYDSMNATSTGAMEAVDRNPMPRGSSKRLAAVSTANTVQNAYIGTDINGKSPVPNAYNGLDIVYGAQSNTIGGTTAAGGNIISGNLYGVYVFGAGTSASGPFSPVMCM